jgi:hypothetical protein
MDKLKPEEIEKIIHEQLDLKRGFVNHPTIEEYIQAGYDHAIKELSAVSDEEMVEQVEDIITQELQYHDITFNGDFSERVKQRTSLLEGLSKALTPFINSKIQVAKQEEREKCLFHYKMMVANILTALENDSIDIVNVLDVLDKKALKKGDKE